jgi:glycosyltransferase involved in cell wall biosynthesis
LFDFLNNQGIGIFNSVYREPFGLVQCEMMAAGLPVIAYDYGGSKEAIIDGQTGFLVEHNNPSKIAEKIEFFLDNRDQIVKMGEAARRHVEQNFTWDRHIGQLIEIYRKILSSDG